ncbi:hypothetical protein N431DRAFT_493562 [Stipitochalara longipes BDJ]|nr:hypothetical protein N431DRAFT_493562 [Stipitochalara longipes BDJ]
MDLDLVTSIRMSQKALRRQRKHGKQASQVLDHFHLFPNLPIELRQKIWNHVMTPQIITWNRRQPVPAVFHTSFESRQLWLKHHKVEQWRSTVFDRETFFIDHSSDIMFFESVIPGLKSWILIPTSIDMETRGLRHGRWLKDVERLAMPYRLAMEEFNVEMPRWDKNAVNPWRKLMAWCPKLEELAIVMGSAGKIGKGEKKLVGEDDWVEIGAAIIPMEPWSFRWDIPNFRVDDFKAGKIKRLRDVKLRFVKQK